MAQGQTPQAPNDDGTEMKLETTRLMQEAEENARRFLQEPIPAEREQLMRDKVRIKRHLQDLKAMQEEMRRCRYAYLFGNSRQIVDQLRGRDEEINRKEHEALIAQVVGPRLDRRELRHLLDVMQETRRKAEGLSQPDAALLQGLSALQERINAMFRNLPENEEEIETLGTEVRGMSNRVGQAVQEQRAAEERSRVEASQRQAEVGQVETTVKPFPMSIKFQAATAGTMRNLLSGRVGSRKTMSGMLYQFVGERAMPSLYTEAAGTTAGEKKMEQGVQKEGERKDTDKKADEKKKDGEGKETEKKAA